MKIVRNYANISFGNNPVDNVGDLVYQYSTDFTCYPLFFVILWGCRYLGVIMLIIIATHCLACAIGLMIGIVIGAGN